MWKLWISLMEWKVSMCSGLLHYWYASVRLHYLSFVSLDSLLIFLRFHGSLKKPMSLDFCVLLWGRENGISWISTFSSFFCLHTSTFVESNWTCCQFCRDWSTFFIEISAKRRKSKVDIKFLASVLWLLFLKEAKNSRGWI